MIKKKPYKLYNSIQNYEWGTIGKDAFIPNLLSVTAEEKPYAELWIGAHPKLSSKLEINNETVDLQKAVNDHPVEILGERVSKKFENKLPFLLKVLSARKALSIQTHPNKEQAKKLHESDPINYPDDNHKPEIAIVLSKLSALVGFRTPNEIIENLNLYPSLKEFLGADVVSDFEQLMQNVNNSEKAIKNIFAELMLRSSDDVRLKQCIDSISDAIRLNNNISKDEKLFVDLKAEYGYDIGLLVIFFLNHIQLNEGDAIFTKAGVPHAYLKGDIIECMANSDNVVRAGLTPKFKDVDTLLSILDYEGSDPRLEGEKHGQSILYSPPNDEFKIEKIIVENGEHEFNTLNQVEILLVTNGEVKVSVSNNSSGDIFAKGEAFMIPAIIDKYMIESNSVSVLFRVSIP